jgi:hypothetical protein
MSHFTIFSSRNVSFAVLREVTFPARQRNQITFFVRSPEGEAAGRDDGMLLAAPVQFSPRYVELL